MPVFASRTSPTSPEFAANREAMLGLVQRMRDLQQRAVDTSNRKADRFAARGQLTPRQRVAHLLDPGAPFLELHTMAGYLVDTDDADASVPGASQITGIGTVSGTRCMVVANDSGINAGALTRMGGGKVLRAQELALENRIPLVMLVESAGANLLEYRVEQWAEGGRYFANLARLSAAGVPVITVLHGSSTAGGAYMPGMSDVVIGVRGRGQAFLAGPPLLKAATGEVADAQDLGGVDMHATVSGLVDHVADDDADGVRIAREVVATMGFGPPAHARLPGGDPPALDPDELCGVVPADYRTAYDVREVVARVVDGSRLLDFKPRYGPATVCVEAEVAGQPVGIIGNNGPIDNAGAQKATHFVQRCGQLGRPLVFLQNITGYMVGTEAERGGMIKNGSKMIQAVTTVDVPRFTFYIGASFGAGNYGMCGQGYDPRFQFSWPNARSGVMGAEQAATTMRIVAQERAARTGQDLDPAFLDGFATQITETYAAQEDAFTTSGRLLDDGMIDPRQTRQVLITALATALEGDATDVHPVSFAVARP